jgi:hypothetical protein
MRWILLIVALLSTQSSFASKKVKPLVLPDNPACIQAKNDPYDPGKIVKSGKYKNQCVDASEKRPAVIIDEDATSITFANFRHLNQFWIARVPKDGVAQVIFRIDPFAGIPHLITVAHTLMGFIMEPGKEILLTPQVIDPATGLTEAASEKPMLISSFYFSVDYMAPKGEDYGLISGKFKTYLTTERFISAQDRDSGTPDPEFPTQLIPLNALNAASRDAVLLGAIHRSNDRSIHYIYDTFLYNCTTELFNLLDDTLIYPDLIEKAKRFKESIWHIFDPVIGPSIHALETRELLDKPEPNPKPITLDGDEISEDQP